VDRKLYLERWLLTLKTAAEGAGLDGHVRALDFKGGNFLAFEVHRGDEALELRYEKRWTGAGQVAVATEPGLTARVRQVHEQLLGQHRRLLENGLRRSLRRSIGLLAALESALRNDAELPRRYEAALREVGGLAGARFAAVVRRRPGLFLKYEVLPAVALREGNALRFAGLSRGQLVDISGLIKTESPRADQGSTPSGNTGFRTVVVAPELAAAGGVELIGEKKPPPKGRAKAQTGHAAGGTDAVVFLEGASCLADATCASIDCGGVPDCNL
jgi:hypothetical protein